MNIHNYIEFSKHSDSENITSFCYKEKGQEKKCLKCLERRKAKKMSNISFPNTFLRDSMLHIREKSQNKNPGCLTFMTYMAKMIASEQYGMRSLL